MPAVTSIRITRHALDEMKDARAWYAQRDPAAANRLSEAIDEALELAAKVPGASTPWPGVPELRRAVVKGFPYWLVYEEGAEGLVVVAFAHHKRRPLYRLP
ncbi:MAG: type II toxin-antitoxin system RelE/ParE family toxin [Myxococcaceae bacterium]|jgi:toxin ParE1/3/4|nr:type II toxin-antitoxin system RelE/ParE family toxin [Myxococcaceae bacterium]